jgi:outer membrane lipoprotein SlyB
MKKLALIGVALLALGGCARNLSQDVYTSNNTVGKVLTGTLVSARPVTVKDQDDTSSGGAGTLAGGALGGVAGSAVGDGTGQLLATVGGAIAGAVAGAYAEDALSTQGGMEYIIRLDHAQKKASTKQRQEKDYSIDRGDAIADDIKDSVSVAETESDLISVIQSDDKPLQAGQRVLVIYNDDRPRVVADTPAPIMN